MVRVQPAAATGPGTHDGARPSRPVRARRPPGLLAAVREAGVVVLVAVVLASLLRAFVVQAFVVPSASMENTLRGGGTGSDDRILVDRLPGQTVRRGQIVVFSDPGGWLSGEDDQPSAGPAGRVPRALQFIGVLPDSSTGHLVKRVVGVGGDTVSCAGPGSPLVVDGVALAESPYLLPGSDPCARTATGRRAWRQVVPAGDLFVLGDNRDDSADSRFNPADPFVPIGDVVGRVVAVAYPFDRISREPVPATFAAIGPPTG